MFSEAAGSESLSLCIILMWHIRRNAEWFLQEIKAWCVREGGAAAPFMGFFYVSLNDSVKICSTSVVYGSV